MLWDNDLTKIRRENVNRIGNMNGTMWDQLAPIVQYLSSFSIPLFEQEVIKKDLIGFAEEADIEGITLGQKLGMQPKGFCDFLLQNREKSTFCWIKDNLVELIVHSIWWMSIFVFVSIAMGENTVDGYDILCSVFFAACSVVFKDTFFVCGTIFEYRGRQAFNKKKWIMRSGIILAILVVMQATLSRYPVVISIGENRWIVVGCFVLISLLFVGIRNWYWNCQSKKYEWKS